MQLVADRFVVDDGQTALDLATSQRVALDIASTGSEREQRIWALSCDAAERRHHPAIARLIDYGLVGGSQRFEAHQILPEGVPSSIDPQTPSILIATQPAVAAIGEAFEHPTGVRPRVVTLWGPEGAGKRTIVGHLARMARQQGFVPVTACLLGGFAELLRGRSLFIIDDGDRRAGWSAWLTAAVGISRPHVLLFVAREDPSPSEGVGVRPMSVDALVGAVLPEIVGGPRASAIRRYAQLSQGWPGRFARLVWGQTAAMGSLLMSAPGRRYRGAVRPASESLRAAEQPAVYGVADDAPTSAPARGQNEREVPGDVALWRGRVEFATRLVAAGRHARGERILRQAVGALARRREWTPAGEGSLALAQLLIRRGRPQDARVVLNAASDFLAQAGDEIGLVDVGVLSAATSLELASLDPAETVASAAAAAARARGDEVRAARALAALSRTLFWRARYDEADATLQSISSSTRDASDAMVVSGLEVAVAVGRSDFRRAVSRGTEALREAQRVGDPRLVAAAARSAAFAHLAVGDLPAVQQEVAVSINAARVSREPLLAVRSRLILAEALRRSGRSSAALAAFGQVVRLGARRLPPIVRARCDLLRDLLAPARAREDVLGRHVSSSGLPALALYGTSGGTASTAAACSRPDDPLVAALVEILDLCQTTDDERTVLAEVCRRVRSRLHAVGVSLLVDEGGERVGMAADGGRIDGGITDRTIAAGVALAPHRSGDRLEAGAPIRSGGTVVGALVARWTIGTPHDLGSAASLMTTVAAAVAPFVAAATARLRHPSVPGMADLLGTSAAMAEVRRGVERAAPAPFAVLIEGESGSGKELVARALHRSGPRRHRALCTLNCAALPDDLVEAELFGHARGAFTGAVGERTGVFEEAHGGTLLLDEIGELSLRAQAKVLRVIQEGELRRVGDTASRRIDVRIVSATNRDLRQEVTAGRFRLDLLYRLDVVRIAVPPLRERRDDIPALAEHFWREATARVGSRATLAPATLAALTRYDWPGNVRELQNALASLAVRSARRGIVPPTALGPQFVDQGSADASRLEEARRTFEERFVRAALVRTGGHRVRAAAELGVTRQGLTKLMSRLGIT